MTPLRLAAVTMVTTALALYTIGALKELRARRATPGVCGTFAAGVAFDAMATVLMMLATQRGGLTLHSVLGYSALAGMATATILMWRHRLRAETEPLGNGLHLFSRIAYVYWVAAYFTGAALAMMSRQAG
jgi:hypothetical protein